jgi:hypothetical protein
LAAVQQEQQQQHAGYSSEQESDSAAHAAYMVKGHQLGNGSLERTSTAVVAIYKAIGSSFTVQLLMLDAAAAGLIHGLILPSMQNKAPVQC